MVICSYLLYICLAGFPQVVKRKRYPFTHFIYIYIYERIENMKMEQSQQGQTETRRAKGSKRLKETQVTMSVSPQAKGRSSEQFGPL